MPIVASSVALPVPSIAQFAACRTKDGAETHLGAGHVHVLCEHGMCGVEAAALTHANPVGQRVVFQVPVKQLGL